VHHLSGDELCDGEPDDVRGAVDVGDDAPDFAAREPAWFGGKALTRFRCCRSCRRRSGWRRACSRCWRASRATAEYFSKLVRAERLDAPLGHIRQIVVAPRVQPHQGDPVWRHGRRKQLQHVAVTVTGERSDGHCVVLGVPTLWGADVGMRVDPQDCQIVTVPTSEFGEWRHAHRALAPERGDPRRVVLVDNL
jgi:hypothetical protein